MNSGSRLEAHRRDGLMEKAGDFRPVHQALSVVFTHILSLACCLSQGRTAPRKRSPY